MTDPALGRFSITLPEPPALNAMLALAKKRTRRTRAGGWMKSSLPVVYDQRLEIYGFEALAMIRLQGIQIPSTPWCCWRLDSAHFQLANLRDPVELLASLKWPVDALVRLGFVAGDSPRELLDTPKPTQIVDRKHRQVTISIAEVAA